MIRKTFLFPGFAGLLIAAGAFVFWRPKVAQPHGSGWRTGRCTPPFWRAPRSSALTKALARNKEPALAFV
jgi:hypothetical protein